MLVESFFILIPNFIIFLVKLMGTQTCIQEKSSLLTTFDPKQWVAITHYPAQVWENQRTGIKSTVHVLLTISQIQKYEYRHLHPNYLLSVINVIPPNNGICNFEESPFLLMLQYVVVKLKQIELLSYVQALYTLKCTLRGYGILSCFYGPLNTNEELILVNQYGNIKVWINEDLTQNQPSISTCIRNQKLSTKTKINQRIKKSISKIISVIENKSERDFPYKFKQDLQNFENYEQAADLVEKFVNFEGLEQLNKIDVSKYIKKREQLSKSQKISGQSSSVSQNQSFLKYQVAKLIQPRNKEENRGNNLQRSKAQFHDKSNTPQSKVQKKSVKSYRQSKKEIPIKPVSSRKKQQIASRPENQFQKFYEMENFRNKQKQLDHSGKIRIQYSSPSPQPVRVCQYSPSPQPVRICQYSPVSNTSSSHQNRTNSPIYSNHTVRDLGQSSKYTDKTFPSLSNTGKNLSPCQSKTIIHSKRQNIAKVPLLQQTNPNYQANPNIRFTHQNPKASEKSPRIFYQDGDNFKKYEENQGISLTQIAEQKNSYKFSSDLDSFINNSMNSNNIDSSKLKSQNKKHLRALSNKPQIKNFSKIRQFAKGAQSNGYEDNRKPIYSQYREKQQFQTDQIIFQKDLMNQISFKKAQKPQKLMYKSNAINNFCSQEPNPTSESRLIEQRDNRLNNQLNKQQKQISSNQEDNFNQKKDKIKQYLIASIEKSQRQKKELEKFKQQLEQQEHFYDESNNNQIFGLLSKEMERRHGYCQSLSLSELQSELSDLLRSSTQYSQESNISMKKSQQNPQTNNKMKKKHHKNLNVLKEVME